MKNDIKEWAAPLVIFFTGELLFLFFLIWMPALDTATAATAAATSSVNATFWGWSWLMTAGVSRAVAMAGYQIGLIIVVGVAFMRSRI